MKRTVSMAETTLTEAEIDAAVDVMRSGALREGPKCAAFEERFAAWVGAGHAITCSNGTAALQLAYMALLEPGDEVIVPSFTFIATASMVSAAGGRPIFCDVDPSTHLIDLDHAETLVSDRTRAIAPVHLFGNSVDVDAVQAFAARHDLRVVWDAAQAHGTLWKGADVGSFPDIVTWSFYPTKNMFTGEGGMIACNDPDLDHRLRLLRSHGVSGRYNHITIGLNCRMSDITAATGLVQMDLIEDRLKQRARNGARLRQALADIDGVAVQAETEHARHSYHQFCATIDPDVAGIDRDTFRERLQEHGVSSGIHYPRGLHQQPVFLDLYGEFSLPVTEQLTERIVALPVHHGLGDGDMDYVAEVAVGALTGSVS